MFLSGGGDHSVGLDTTQQMTELSPDYTDAEWLIISKDAPLEQLDSNQAYTLHRYWFWVNYQWQHFDGLPSSRTENASDFLATERGCTMCLWYSLLWSLIEGMCKRNIVFAGEMKEDLQYVSERLRRCRNAVFHVPSGGQWDSRLYEIMFDPAANHQDEPQADKESALRIRRLTAGLGRLFDEEPGRRGI